MSCRRQEIKPPGRCYPLQITKDLVLAQVKIFRDHTCGACQGRHKAGQITGIITGPGWILSSLAQRAHVLRSLVCFRCVPAVWSNMLYRNGHEKKDKEILRIKSLFGGSSICRNQGVGNKSSVFYRARASGKWEYYIWWILRDIPTTFYAEYL